MLAAEVGVVTGQVDDRRPATHPALAHPQPPEMTGRTSIESLSFEAFVAGHEGAVADHEMRLTVEAEFVEQGPHRTGTLDLHRPPRVAQQNVQRL